MYRVSQKKGGSRFQAHLEALNGFKSKSGRIDPPSKFNFTYWDVFSGQLLDCRNGLRACLIFDSVPLQSQHC